MRQHLIHIVLGGILFAGQVSAAVIMGPVTNPANGHTYFLLSQGCWTAAEAEAITLGGHLVTINDQAENDFVFNTFGPLHTNDDLWIGFNDVAVEGTFEWVSGEPITFTNWACCIGCGPEPNNCFGDDYGVIWRFGGGQGGQWADLTNCAVAVPNSTPYGVVEVVPESCDPAPLSQGYWHRQCLGLPATNDPETSGIDPGRNGRGPQEPSEPEFSKVLMPEVNNLLEAALGPSEAFSCATGMDANPPSDPCERAIKQYTALLFNRASSRLQNSCEVDFSAEACGSTDIGTLVDELAGLINSDDPDNCELAADCAAAVNEGTALTESLVVRSVPTEVPLGTDLTELDWRIFTGRVANAPASDVEEAAGEAAPEVSVVPVMPVGIVTEASAVEPQKTLEVPTAEEDEAATLKRHLAVLANASAPERARTISTDALLTTLSGGYELEVRIQIVRGLLGQVDVAYESLLAEHLRDIRDEAEAFGKEDLAKEAEKLLKRLEPAEQ